MRSPEAVPAIGKRFCGESVAKSRKFDSRSPESRCASTEKTPEFHQMGYSRSLEWETLQVQELRHCVKAETFDMTLEALYRCAILNFAVMSPSAVDQNCACFAASLTLFVETDTARMSGFLMNVLWH